MKTKVTYEWILAFNSVRGYLNLVDKATNKALVTPGPDVAWATARTGKRLKDDMEILQEKEREKVDFLASNTDEKEKEEFLKQWETEWKELLKREVEVDLYQFKFSSIPKSVNLPEGFYDILEPLITND
jgi:hypothetical protein